MSSMVRAINSNMTCKVRTVRLLADTPQWIVARKNFPAKDLKEFIEWLKQNPGKATAGTVGVGGPEVTGIYFQNRRTSFPFVPYRGGAPLNQDMLAGQIDFGFGQAASSFVHVRNATLKPMPSWPRQDGRRRQMFPPLMKQGSQGFMLLSGTDSGCRRERQ